MHQVAVSNVHKLYEGGGPRCAALRGVTFSVEAGEFVEQGELIAEIGMTGRASGPHLDWRMNWLDRRVDPQLLMSGVPE